MSGRARIVRVKNPVVSVPRIACTRPCEFGFTPVTSPVAGFTMMMVESSGVTHTTGAPTLSPFALSGTAMNCVVSPKSTIGGRRRDHLDLDHAIGQFSRVAAGHESQHQPDAQEALHCDSAWERQLAQGLFRVLHPALRVGALWRPRQELAQVHRGRVRLAPLEQQERQAVVGAHQRRIHLERATVEADRLLLLRRLGERNRHVEHDAGVVRVVPMGQPVRGQGRLVVPLTLEGERLIEVIQPLRAEIVLAPEKSSPDTHERRAFSGCK